MKRPLSETGTSLNPSGCVEADDREGSRDTRKASPADTKKRYPRYLTDIIKEYELWVDHNFGAATEETAEEKAIEQLLGVVEEVGELAHSLLKQKQGIRGTDEEHASAQRDAVGDVAIFLMGFCYRKGWNLEDVLVSTWRDVRTRDWVLYPKNGRTE